MCQSLHPTSHTLNPTPVAVERRPQPLNPKPINPTQAESHCKKCPMFKECVGANLTHPLWEVSAPTLDFFLMNRRAGGCLDS